MLENLIPDNDQRKNEILFEFLKGRTSFSFQDLPIDLDLQQKLETGGKNISQGKR